MATNYNATLSLPVFIPLPEAARKYNLTEDVLTQLVQDGRIEAAQLPTGDVVVSDTALDQAKTKEQIIDEKFRHLQGRALSMSESSRKYGIAHPTVYRWVKKGYIKRLGREGTKVLIDASEMAYCAEVYRLEGGRQGKRIFDRDGNPYQLKQPERASA